MCPGNDPRSSFTHKPAVLNDLFLCGRVHDRHAKVHGATVLVGVVEKLEYPVLHRVGCEESKGLGPVFLPNNFWRPGGQLDRKRLWVAQSRRKVGGWDYQTCST